MNLRVRKETPKNRMIRLLEEKLSEAIGKENREGVVEIMDRLYRRGVSEGFAVEAARRFLRELPN